MSDSFHGCIGYLFMLENILIDHHYKAHSELTDLLKNTEFTELPTG